MALNSANLPRVSWEAGLPICFMASICSGARDHVVGQRAAHARLESADFHVEALGTLEKGRLRDTRKLLQGVPDEVQPTEYLYAGPAPPALRLPLPWLPLPIRSARRLAGGAAGGRPASSLPQALTTQS